MLFLLVCYPAIGQVVFDLPDKEKRAITSHLLASFHVAIGLVDPTDVNHYISAFVEDKSGGGVFFYHGNPDISVACSFNFSVIYRTRKNFQFSFPVEFGTAPKTITVDDDVYKFSMNRFSIGPMVSYNLYHQHGSAFYTGIGILFHAMWFDKTSASVPGPRFELGYTHYGMRNDFDFFINVDVAEAKSKDVKATVKSIDFSGVYFGTRIIL